MPFPLRIYTLLRKLNQHKLNVNLSDVVKNPSTNLILQLEYISNIIDSFIESSNFSMDDLDE